MKLRMVFWGILGFALTGCGQQEPVLARVADNVITQPQFAAYLRVKRIPSDDAAVSTDLLASYVQQEALAQAIAQSGALDENSIEAEVREFRKQLVINQYFSTFLDAQVNEQAIRNFYNLNKEKYATSKVHVAHILVRLSPGASDEQMQSAQSRISDAYAKVISGMSFEEAAERFSEDAKSAKKGGDIGWISERAMQGEFIKAAFNLGKDAISEPVRSQLGYHIIRVVEPPVQSYQPYEKIKGDIRYQLRQEAKQAEMERLKQTITWSLEAK